MKICIKKPGLLGTVQDLGRMHYLSQAVPVSGAMDRLSARIANKAVGNDDDNAVIEFTHGGASFITESGVLIALSGEGASINIENKIIPSDRPVFIPAGTTVALGNSKLGSRSYLAVAGGWDIPEVLGSRSTYLTANMGGLNGRRLAKNDRLVNTGNLTALSQVIYNSLQGETTNYPKWGIGKDLFLPVERNIIRVMRGREIDWFEEASVAGFFSKSYSVGRNSNRMGYHLQGVAMKRTTEGELLSTAVTPGTIQVTNDGSLILLMADCQTTGGYPRIAQVAAVDLPLCGQLKPGDEIYFKEISWKEAEQLYFDRKRDLDKVSPAIRMRYGLM